MERLQKYLARCGQASRRKAEELIALGEVYVNGERITEPGFKVEPENDIVTLGGKEVKAPLGLVYYMLNKPMGYISTAHDEKGRKSVISLVPCKQRIYPVGRLDYNTTGLLILTNDGELTYRLTHPANMTDKEYIAVVSQPLNEKALSSLRQGVDIGGFVTNEAKVIKLSPKYGKAVYKIIIHEGKNRQVRRMFEAVGTNVLHLHREAVGNLRLGSLKPGDYRILNPKEVSGLYN